MEQRRLIKNYPEARQKALAIRKDSASEITTVIAMFNLIARQIGRGEAYEFVQGIFQEVAVYSMAALCQIDEWVKCEGNVFENFKKLNIAWFTAMNDEGTWAVGEMKDHVDQLTIVVTECTHCVVAGPLSAPR